MAEPLWLLGPAGMMLPLSCPEPGIEYTRERFGGVHQGLTGSRTMDVTGFRDTYKLKWQLQDNDEWAWLDACYNQQVRGQLYLRNPMRKNLLSRQAASLTWVPDQRYGLSLQSGYAQYVNDVPSTEVRAFTAIKAQGMAATDQQISFDDAYRTPVVPGQTYTFSIWLKASGSGGAQVKMRIYRFADPNSTNLGYVEKLVTVTTSWQRFTQTYTIPTGAPVISPVLLVSNAVNYSLYGPQLEQGSTATSFELGGGTAPVLFDSLSTSSDMNPLTELEATFLEA